MAPNHRPTGRSSWASSPALQTFYVALYIMFFVSPAKSCYDAANHKFPIPASGPCSSDVTVSITVRAVADIYKRAQYPNTTTVFLLFTTNLTLTSQLLLDASFSCTVLCSIASGPIWLRATSDQFVPLAIYNTSNVYIGRINIGMPFYEPNSLVACPNVPEPGLNQPAGCAAVHTYNAYGILMYGCTLLGRLDVYRTTSSWFNNLTIANPSLALSAVRFGLCGNATDLIASDVHLINSELTGGDNGIMLHWESVGVHIEDNYIHNFTRFGVTCGWGATFVADCFGTYFARNLLVVEPWKVIYGDGAAIYMNGKFHNPVNYFYKNMAVGGQNCVYFDWATSGVILDGIVCVGQWNGFKINNGKFNNVRNALLVNIRQLSGWISCQNWDVNNCMYNAKAWVDAIFNMRRADLWLQYWPRYRTICSQTSVYGVPCNPPRNLTGVPWSSALAAPPQATGNCSGLPTESSVDLVLYNISSVWRPIFRNCNSSVPTVPYLSNLTFASFNASQLRFDDAPNGDYGISDRSSPIYSARPAFQTVKRSEVGPKPSNESTFFSRFNVFNTILPFVPLPY